MSGQDCDGAWGQAPIRSLLALPRALLAPPRIESTDQAEGMMPVSERVRPEPRWPGIHHRSLRSLRAPVCGKMVRRQAQQYLKALRHTTTRDAVDPVYRFERARSKRLVLLLRQAQYGTLWPTNTYGRYHHLRNVARQPIDAPRSLNSCSVTRRDAGTLMRRDRVVGRHGW